MAGSRRALGLTIANVLAVPNCGASKAVVSKRRDFAHGSGLAKHWINQEPEGASSVED
jgi:hypothetical protein